MTKWMNFNCPVLETSESIEPKDYDDLELNAIACTFSKIFQSELKELLRRYHELLPQRWTKKLKKLSLLRKISLCCRGILEHKSAQGGQNKMDQIGYEASLFFGRHFQNKTSKTD